MSTLGVFSTPGGYHEYAGGVPRCMWGVIMSTPGVFSTPEGYHEYTGDFGMNEKSRDQISRIFVLAPFATMQLYMLAFGTSDSLL